MEASCRRRSMTRRPILRRFESDVPFGKRSQIRLHRVGITGDVLRDVLDEKEVDELEFWKIVFTRFGGVEGVAGVVLRSEKYSKGQ